jgi:hypothetical protein
MQKREQPLRTAPSLFILFRIRYKRTACLKRCTGSAANITLSPAAAGQACRQLAPRGNSHKKDEPQPDEDKIYMRENIHIQFLLYYYNCLFNEWLQVKNTFPGGPACPFRDFSLLQQGEPPL